MKPPASIELDKLHNLASHIHVNKDLRAIIDKEFNNHYQSFLHYTVIGSKFCPRVLLTCEMIIKNIYQRDQYDRFKQYIETREHAAYD